MCSAFTDEYILVKIAEAPLIYMPCSRHQEYRFIFEDRIEEMEDRKTEDHFNW